MNTFNWDATGTYCYVDQENKMMLVKNASWNKNGDNGKGDSIGRSKDAFYIYNDYRFIEGIEDCWIKVPNKGIRRLFRKWHWQGYRYPTYANGTEINSGDKLSRDHLKNTVIAYKYAGKTDKEMWDFVKRLRWRISKFAMFTPELWLFVRLLSGRKFATWMYPRLTFIVKVVTSWWQLRVEKKSGFGPHFEEDQNTFKLLQNSFKPDCINHCSKKLHPIYTLLQNSQQARYIKNDKWKKKCMEQIYKITPTYNYAIKLYVNHPEGITEDMIMSYKSMKGGRWSGIMNIWWNDRSLYINTNEEEIEYNVMDVDYIRKLWETLVIK